MFNRHAILAESHCLLAKECNRDFILACFFFPGDLVEMLTKNKDA
jgi:hypothetical protein